MVANALTAPHLRPRREKVFGAGRPRALDRNAKVRIMARARALKVKTKKGEHYGALTAKDCDVLEALLWLFHNCKTGLCFPSYEFNRRQGEMLPIARRRRHQAVGGRRSPHLGQSPQARPRGWRRSLWRRRREGPGLSHLQWVSVQRPGSSRRFGFSFQIQKSVGNLELRFIL